MGCSHPWRVCRLSQEGYVERHGLPVRQVLPSSACIGQTEPVGLETEAGTLYARAVVVATGNQRFPVRPSWSSELPRGVRQVDCSSYRNSTQTPRGAVLVVGSGQSGGQIAEDLVQAGRKVFLATSLTARLVRRYRGGNSFNWLSLSGFADVPRRQLGLENGKLPPRPLLGATHTISLQSLSSQGVILLGRLEGFAGGNLVVGDQLERHMRFADESSETLKRVSTHISIAPASKRRQPRTIPPKR